MKCPCQSTQTYQNCCEPFHNQTATPTTAEQLMRSRYSAFVLQNIDYIINTTVPAQQPLLDKQAISDWAKQTDWAGLQIINHIPKSVNATPKSSLKPYLINSLTRQTDKIFTMNFPPLSKSLKPIAKNGIFSTQRLP